jgi:hypothetical protein
MAREQKERQGPNDRNAGRGPVRASYLGDDVPELLPPLEPESEVVKEMMKELQQAAMDAYPGSTDLSDVLALLVLEASRYLEGPNGWPDVDGALRCLRKRKRVRPVNDGAAAICRSDRLQDETHILAEVQQIAERAGVDAATAKRLRAKAQQMGAANLVTAAIALMVEERRAFPLFVYLG